MKLKSTTNVFWGGVVEISCSGSGFFGCAALKF